MKRKQLVFVLAVAAVAGLLAFAGYESTWGDARCASCHDDESFVAQSRGAHAAIECTACHTSGGALGRTAFNVRHLPRLIPFMNSLPTRDLSAVEDVRCLACHDAIYGGIVSGNGIRVDHALCTPTMTCTQCHSTTAHGRAVSWIRTYDMETCLECHVSEGLADCETCHEGRVPEERITSGVFSVTHGADWEQTHAMGNAATCSACHTAADCGTCHGPGLPHGESFMAEHAPISRDPEAQCFDCHEQRFCDDCHGLDMPHPRAFIEEHSTAANENRPLCDRCHAGPDCTTCHEKHVHPGGAIGTLPGGDSSR